MKSCPQCGKNENEITMETGREISDENRVWCSCGFTGTYGDLGNPVPKNEEPKLTDREKLEVTAKELGIDILEGITDDELKDAIKAAKTSRALSAEAEKLGIGIKEGTTDDEIKALIKAAKKGAAK